MSLAVENQYEVVRHDRYGMQEAAARGCTRQFLENDEFSEPADPYVVVLVIKPFKKRVRSKTLCGRTFLRNQPGFDVICKDLQTDVSSPWLHQYGGGGMTVRIACSICFFDNSSSACRERRGSKRPHLPPITGFNHFLLAFNYTVGGDRISPSEQVALLSCCAAHSFQVYGIGFS